MKKIALCIALASAVALPPAGIAAESARQADVARRGAEVMPFDLKATTHVFTKTDDGGTQRVVAKDASDVAQTRLVREHLRGLEASFRKGDFSGPAHIHGHDMPGLAELEAARPGALTIAYRDVAAGAELRYRTRDPRLVEALHAWFDAQLADHGADAMAGHSHAHMHPPSPAASAQR